MSHRLSKSKIMSGRQCEKRLWLEVHQPQLKAVSAAVEHRLSAGEEVNVVARALYGDGHFIEPSGNLARALAETQQRLKDAPQQTLFEATFSHQGVLVRADVLEKMPAGYRLIEVKSSTSVKAPYAPDCAVQAWVLEGAGVAVAQVELAHINKHFIYGGDGDYRGLFTHANLTAAIAELKPEVPAWVARFKKVLGGAQPAIEVGAHCDSPYACPFKHHCGEPRSGYPVTDLPGKNANALAAQLQAEGIHDIRDIPPGRLPTAKLERVRRATCNDQAELNPAAAVTIASCTYPRYYLDFETIAFAVPIWKDTRPYQALPFQWSCHSEQKNSALTHSEFLDTSGAAPMRAFIETLLAALQDSGAIFVYSAYEKTCLGNLAARFPDLAPAISRVIARLVDLLPVTRANYYHRDMHGSWSIKAVLPTIAAHLDYRDLGEVQDGNAAGRAYVEIIHPRTAPARAQALAADLRAYCQRDTEAMVALVEFLSAA